MNEVKNKAIRFHELGGPEVLKLEEVEVGLPKTNELRIRVEAVALNRAEALFRNGQYLVKPKLPSLICAEGAGIVDKVGEGIEGIKEGDRVCIIPSGMPGAYGICGEMAIVPMASVIPAPKEFSVLEAASVWVQYSTALALVEYGKLSLGNYVIIPAASSSIGIAAIQVCNWAGAVPIAVTRSRSKVAELKKHGAQHVIVTNEDDLVEEVMRITNGKGAEIVFDCVAGPYVETLVQAMAEEGILFVYGELSGEPTPHPHSVIARKRISQTGFTAYSIWEHPERFARVKDLIIRGLGEGKLTPLIDKIFTLAQVVEANQYAESNQQIGKIMIKI